MKRTCIGLLVGCCVVMPPVKLQAATSWDHVKVLPKSARLQVLQSPDDRRSIALGYEIEWPATVEKTDGQWLKIVDGGGYSVAPIDGWVRKDDIVRMENVQAYCTGKIRESEAAQRFGTLGLRNRVDDSPPQSLAELYWMRGIYWENQRDAESAIADYDRVIAQGWETGDVYLRLGRLQTDCGMKFEDQDFAGNTFICDCADKNFAKAEKLFARYGAGIIPPRFYVNRGDALSNRFKASGDFSYAKRALADYCQAEQINSSWPLPAYKQGKLLLGLLEQSSKKDGTQSDKRTLLSAIQHFTQAVRLDPNCAEAYRDRAEALLALATAGDVTPPNIAALQAGLEDSSPNRPFQLHLPVNPPPGSVLAILDEALNSADRAYELSNNREARALEIKSRVQFAIAQELHNPNDPDLKLDKRARLAEAYSLFQRATDLANSAANNSSTINEITDRLTLALSYEDSTYLLADTLADRAANSNDKLKSQLAAAKDQLVREKKSLELQKSNQPQDAASLKSFVAQADDAQKRIDAAQTALDLTTKQPNATLEKSVRSKISDAGKALVDLGKTKGMSNFGGAAAKPFKLSVSHGSALLDTVESAPSEESPPSTHPSRVIYAPLYLNAR
jgi:hypothetical protein